MINLKTHYVHIHWPNLKTIDSQVPKRNKNHTTVNRSNLPNKERRREWCSFSSTHTLILLIDTDRHRQHQNAEQVEQNSTSRNEFWLKHRNPQHNTQQERDRQQKAQTPSARINETRQDKKHRVRNKIHLNRRISKEKLFTSFLLCSSTAKRASSSTSVELEAPWESWTPPSVDAIRSGSSCSAQKWADALPARTMIQEKNSSNNNNDKVEEWLFMTEERFSEFLSSLSILWKTSSRWDMNENRSLPLLAPRS